MYTESGDNGMDVKNIGLIEAKNNIVAMIQNRLQMNAYYKKSLTEEQILELQRFFRSCNKALTELETREAVFAVTNVINQGEQLLKVI